MCYTGHCPYEDYWGECRIDKRDKFEKENGYVPCCGEPESEEERDIPNNSTVKDETEPDNELPF